VWVLRVESNSGISQKADDSAVTLRPAPTLNRRLPQRLGNFDTLAKGLDYAARGETGYTFYSGRGAIEDVLTYAELRERARRSAHRLLNAGLRKGDRVAVVAETSPRFLEVFFACQYAGLVPCPMPYSMQIGGRDAFIDRLAGMMRSSAVSLAIAPDDLKPHLDEAAALAGGGAQVLVHDDLMSYPAHGATLTPMGKDEVAYIQYSSGSTSAPKGVLISQRAITANVRGILQHGLKITPEDRAFSWLPLYHDMGLVGFCLSPMMGQVSVDYLATTAFARRPGLWLKLMAENRCTASYSPSFGYDLAARRVTADMAGLDLSAWRVAGIGGDMVRHDVPSRPTVSARKPSCRATAWRNRHWRSPSAISTNRRASTWSTAPTTSCRAGRCRPARAQSCRRNAPARSSPAASRWPAIAWRSAMMMAACWGRARSATSWSPGRA
jgi:fatty-acyl-CoA synthase